MLPPEEGLDEYTVDELERWTLRRYQAQDVWMGSRQPRFRSRVIDPRLTKKSSFSPSYREIVPGGRWLLIAYPSAAMYVIDLDDTNPVPRVLCDPKTFDQELSRQKAADVDYAFWIDRSKPRLSLRIAGCIAGEGNQPSSTMFQAHVACLSGSLQSTRTFVYQVELVGRGAGATLAARPHALFRNHYPGHRSISFGLNDHYVVEVWDDWDGKSVGFNVNKEIKVYHYSKALVAAGCLEYPSLKPIVHQLKGNLCMVRSRLVSDPLSLMTFQVVEFIYKSVFAIRTASPHLVHLFEINCPDGSTTPDSIKLLHTVEAYYCHFSYILPFPGILESRFVMLGASREVKGLVIPHDKTISPTVVQLGRCHEDWDLMNCCMVGICGSLIFDRESKTYGILTHDWNPTITGRSIPPLLPKHQAPHLSDELLTFDEGTGRLVFLNDTWDHTLLIVDVV